MATSAAAACAAAAATSCPLFQVTVAPAWAARCVSAVSAETTSSHGSVFDGGKVGRNWSVRLHTEMALVGTPPTVVTVFEAVGPNSAIFWPGVTERGRTPS